MCIYICIYTYPNNRNNPEPARATPDNPEQPLTTPNNLRTTPQQHRTTPNNPEQPPTTPNNMPTPMSIM